MSFNPPDGLGVVRTRNLAFRTRQQWCFNPSDGLGVVRTTGVDLRAEQIEAVSIPRTGWGWFGQAAGWRGSFFGMRVSIPRTGWGWFGLRAPRSLGPIDLCFNPSDGLGVVRTPFAQPFVRPFGVSIPRTGWGWFGRLPLCEACAKLFVSIPRTGWGWFGRVRQAQLTEIDQFQSLGRVGGGSDYGCRFAGRTDRSSFNPSDGLGVVRTLSSRLAA